MNCTNDNIKERQIQGQGEKPKTSKFATASAVAGVAALCTILVGALITCFELFSRNTADLVGWILFFSVVTSAAIGLMLGIIAIVKIKRSRGHLVGKREAILGMCVSAFILLPSFSYISASVRYVRAFQGCVVACNGNLHTLGEAMRVYANQNDNKYPPHDRWCDLLIESSNRERELLIKAFVCQGAVMTGNDMECHYSLNPNAEPNSGDEIVLLFDSTGGWNWFGGPELLAPENHGGKGCNILFNDGSVEFVKTDALKDLKWK